MSTPGSCHVGIREPLTGGSMAECWAPHCQYAHLQRFRNIMIFSGEASALATAATSGSCSTEKGDRSRERKSASPSLALFAGLPLPNVRCTRFLPGGHNKYAPGDLGRRPGRHSGKTAISTLIPYHKWSEPSPLEMPAASPGAKIDLSSPAIPRKSSAPGFRLVVWQGKHLSTSSRR